MKRYLLRAGFNPVQSYTAKDYLFNCRHIIGENSGNLVFAYGVMNALKTKDVELDFFYEVDKPELSDEEVQKINATYDAFIMPMADAFREPYIEQLKWWTKLIDRLKIPVVVIGIGLSASYEPDFDSSFGFDDAAREFVSSVLNHSSMLGLRGEITGKYLSKLGFKEGTHFTAIGCPSLYTYGDCFYDSRDNPTKDQLREGRLLFNARITRPPYSDTISSFTLNTIHAIKDHVLVQQLTREFFDMYIGNHFFSHPVNFKIPFTELEYNSMKKEDRVRFFMDVPSWIEFASGFSLFVGSRIHGCVAAVLSGIPYVFLPSDARTRELVEYHHLTSISPLDLNPEKSIMDYLDVLDFNSLENHHKENFNHYIGFLKVNGLDTIFTEKRNYERGESPLEQTVKKSGVLSCLESLSPLRKWNRILTVKMWKVKNKFFSIG